MKNLKKVFIFFFVSAITTNLFAQNWYLCLGSFKSEKNAFQRIELLENNNFSICYTEFEKSETESLYRILLDEPYDDLNQAHIKMNEITKDTTISELGITGIWCCQAENTKRLTKADPEKRYILIKDSDTGNPIPDADVKFDKKWESRTSDEGKAPLPEQVKDGEHEIEVTKGNEYVPTVSTIKIEKDEIVTTNHISIPKKVEYDRFKIILEWKDYPSDLDSHILLDNYHVYYINRDDANLNLDRDDTDGYGPETTTIKNPKSTDLYRFYVYNFSDDYPSDGVSLSNSGATVKVFFGNELKKTFTIEPGRKGILWHVFDIKNNEIVVVNKVETKYRTMFDEESYTPGVEIEADPEPENEED